MLLAIISPRLEDCTFLPYIAEIYSYWPRVCTRYEVLCLEDLTRRSRDALRREEKLLQEIRRAIPLFVPRRRFGSER